ncbi:rhomboid family intramembrane serine protease [Marininema halotolerans]|uniref:Rhomboid protease GluP n=1 Tax=Marininema halotolerans TaxID=1155944 RepID=A0A1I6RQT1_9BACL|nr:rhomboid family intramembrane serine protease [Marininema halotolerans]SFS67042.1 rhomboid protease GluP [Marininema halotolerans]
MFNHTQLPLRRFRSYFPIVTCLLLIQLGIFLLMTFNGGSTNVNTLLRFGALEQAHLEQGEWWRLITPLFIHIGIAHLLFNSFALYLLGPQLEWLFGKWRFILLYMGTGFFANLASTTLNPIGIKAGASGAIYGLFGVYLYLILFRRGAMDQQAGKSILALVGINLVVSVISPSVDLVGHLGGLFAGMCLAGPLLRGKYEKQREYPDE